MRIPAFHPLPCDRHSPEASIACGRRAVTLAMSMFGITLLCTTLTATQVARAASDTPPDSAEASVYCLDPVHTRVMLAIDHAGFSKALGTVSGSSGELRFDAQDWSQARVRVSVPLNRLDFGDDKWNKAVLASNLLDAARYPNAIFVSERVEPIEVGRAKVHGTLELHGVSQPVVLDATLNAMKRYPLPPFRRTVGFSARATLSRKAFGVDAWASVIGDEVELRIEAEATRGRCDDKAPEPQDKPDDAPANADPASDQETLVEQAPAIDEKTTPVETPQ
jgi:polyisoprenoid-binding protein YceI